MLTLVSEVKKLFSEFIDRRSDACGFETRDDVAAAVGHGQATVNRIAGMTNPLDPGRMVLEIRDRLAQVLLFDDWGGLIETWRKFEAGDEGAYLLSEPQREMVRARKAAESAGGERLYVVPLPQDDSFWIDTKAKELKKTPAQVVRDIVNNARKAAKRRQDR